MLAADRFRLHFSPYRMPRCRVGKRLRCLLRGKVVVAAISDGRIQWPMTRLYRGRAFLIVCGGLAKAVRRESELAVCHWWGVGTDTVWRWRRALGVAANNAGTTKLRKAWAPEVLTEVVRARARAAANTPEANAK